MCKTAVDNGRYTLLGADPSLFFIDSVFPSLVTAHSPSDRKLLKPYKKTLLPDSMDAELEVFEHCVDGAGHFNLKYCISPEDEIGWQSTSTTLIHERVGYIAALKVAPDNENFGNDARFIPTMKVPFPMNLLELRNSQPPTTGDSGSRSG